MLPHPAESSALWLVLCWLATWRLTALVSYEAGPFDVLGRLRVRLARAGLHRLVGCFHCTALWISVAVGLLAYDIRPRSLLIILGIAGATSVTERLLGSSFDEPAGQADP